MHNIKTVFRGVCLMAMVALLFAGCGSDEAVYHISGKVTFDGKPVPAGRIIFTPDGSVENNGAPGYATIKDGVFDTKSPGGKPHTGGAMAIRIEGMEPAGEPQPDPENPDGETINLQPLFPVFQTTATLPDSESTQDFNVPASAADRDIPEGEGNLGGGP